MIRTGKLNKITGEEILQAEEKDNDFSKNWEELTIEQKATFCSFMRIGFLNKDVEPKIKAQWEYYNEKHWGGLEETL